MDSHDLNTILIALHKSMEFIKSMLEKGEDDCPKVKVLEDENDHHHQRALRGKFMISSNKENNIIKKEKTLKEEGKSVPKYVTELIQEKLGEEVKEEELVSCHHTSTGLVFRLADLKPGSTFSKIVGKIKSGQGKDVPNIYINFALTHRRAALLFEVRQLRRAKKLSKCYVTTMETSRW